MQWLSLLGLIFAGMICTAILIRQRDTLLLSARLVFLLAIATRLPPLFSVPLMDDDFFRFLWDGHQITQGLSPYTSAPSEHFLRTDITADWAVVLSEINHPDVPTIYGPSLQAIFWLASMLGGADPVALRSLLVAADVGLVALLLRAGATPWLVMLYVVNPLVIKEVGFSLHPDSLIGLWLTLMLLAALRRRSFILGICAALVVCAKLPLVLLAAALNMRLETHRRGVAWCALLTLCAYLPFVIPNTAEPFAGLRAFADVWRYNALGFVVFERLSDSGLGARSMLAIFYVTCGAILSYRVAHQKTPLATGLVLFFALILFAAPTVNPWYWMPLLPLGIVAAVHDRVLLITPWVGSFALMLGYCNGGLLADLGWSASHVAARVSEFSVLAPASLAQIALICAALAYDFSAKWRVALSAVSVAQIKL
jgi:alpha-1,6-mannosyltransferase